MMHNGILDEKGNSEDILEEEIFVYNNVPRG
jgi:hypothetical protein